MEKHVTDISIAKIHRSSFIIHHYLPLGLNEKKIYAIQSLW
jgi:hypothetical protein